MTGLDSGMLILVRACCVVRHVVDYNRDRRVVRFGVRLQSEESVDIGGK
jgi:hypothetical protein